MANSTSINIILGLAKHRRCTLWVAGEVALDFCLSVFLARRIGIYGRAIGTTFPNLFVALFWWPRYICSIVGVSLRQHLAAAAKLAEAGACRPTLRDCVLRSGSVLAGEPTSRFSLQIVAIIPAYIIALLLPFVRI